MSDSAAAGTVDRLDDRHFDQLAPAVRQDALVRTYGSEMISWAPGADGFVHLDAVGAVVFQCLDGGTTVGELVADVHDVVGVPPSIARRRVRGVVAQLNDRGLIGERDVAAPTGEDLGLFPGPDNP